MNVDFIRDHIQPELVKICEKEGWKPSQPNLGRALERWIAQFFVAYNGLPKGEDIEDSILGSKDLGVDVLLNDDSQKRCYVVQSKYRSAKSATSPDTIRSFFKLHSSLMVEQWTQHSNASDRAKIMLREYQGQMEDHWQARWVFVTTNKVSDTSKEIAAHCTEEYDRMGDNVECEVVDAYVLERMYKQFQSRNKPIPQEIEINLGSESYIHSPTPRETLVAVVKGDQLSQWYTKHHEGLFVHNIRLFMPKGKMSKDIIGTAKNKPEDFFYFNNGISAICSRLDVDDANKTATAYDMQIVNGAQTVGALHSAKAGDNVRVMLRLVVGESSTESGGFNENVIKCNNSQTAVKDSDFRSNDPIQRSIKHGFQARGVIPVLGKRIDYQPKRGGEDARWENCRD